MVCDSSPTLKTNDKDFDDLAGILRYELFYQCSYMCHNLSLIIQSFWSCYQKFNFQKYDLENEVQ